MNGLLSGEYDFACDLPPDQLDAVRNTAGLEVQGSTILNHRIQVFDKVHPVLSDPLIRRAMTHSIDRQLIVNALWDGQTKVPAGLQFEFYDDMFIKGWTAPEFNLEMARDLVKQSGYQGDAIPFRVLNNYYINQVSNAQIMVEMWKQAGLNVEIQMVENWGQVLEDNDTRGIRDWSNSATFNDPVSSIVAQHGPNGLQQQQHEWTNVEMNELSNFMQKSTDRGARKKRSRGCLKSPSVKIPHSRSCTRTACSPA